MLFSKLYSRLKRIEASLNQRAQQRKRTQHRRTSNASIPAAIERLEDRTLLSNVAVFDNGSFVDTVGGFASESDNVQASLALLGHTVTTFTGTSASAISSALAGQDVLLIPKQERGNLVAVLDPSARTAIQSFVSNGGGLIIHGYSNRADDFLNGVFGFTTFEAYASSSSHFSKTVAAAGTEFADDPSSIPWNNGTGELLSGLPAGSKTIYSDGSGSAVALMPFGSGQITYLGWDWWNAAPVGSQDGGWLQVLDSAVEQVSPNDPPVADANGPYIVNEGSSITLSAAGSSDSDGTISTFEWDFDFDGVFDVDATGPSPVLSASDLDGPIMRRIALRVTDNDGATDLYTTAVTVNNVAPTLVLDPVTAIDENGVATLTGTISDPGTSDTFTLEINWGDTLSPNNVESYTFGASPIGTQSFSLTHQYLDDNPTATSVDSYTIVSVA